MVCSIIGATLFVPCVFGLGVVGAIYVSIHNIFENYKNLSKKKIIC